MEQTSQVVKKTRAKKTVDPKIILKGQQEFRHDLFKADVAIMKKNVSYKKGVVELRDVEHCHFFHTFNSQARIQKYTNAVGGHFHEIKWLVNDNGDLVAKCGPALRHTYKPTPAGQKKLTKTVQWMDEINDEMVKDDHVHDMKYIYSENLTPETVRQIQNVTQSQIEMRDQAKELGMEQGFEA